MPTKWAKVNSSVYKESPPELKIKKKKPTHLSKIFLFTVQAKWIVPRDTERVVAHPTARSGMDPLPFPTLCQPRCHSLGTLVQGKLPHTLLQNTIQVKSATSPTAAPKWEAAGPPS